MTRSALRSGSRGGRLFVLLALLVSSFGGAGAAWGAAQPTWLSVIPADFYIGQCYTMHFGGGAWMTVDYQVRLNGGPVQTVTGIALNQYGERTFCTSPQFATGEYQVVGIRNSSNTAWVPVSVWARARPAQPTWMTIYPSTVYQGECYTLYVGWGANMTIDYQWSFNGGPLQTVVGWPTLDANGQYTICTAPDELPGNRRALKIRNTLNTAWVAVDTSVTVLERPSFTLGVTATSSTLLRGGGSASYAVSMSPTGGFSSAVSLAALSLPSGVNASWSRTSISGSQTATLTLTAPTASASLGSRSFQIRGTGGGVVQTRTATVQIQDVQLAASPTTMTILAEKGASGEATLSLNNLGGFAGAVSFPTGISPRTGVTVTVQPSSISGNQTAVVRWSELGLAPGDYPFTVTGSHGTAQRSIALLARLQDFSLQATPGARTVVRGAPASYALSLANQNGFSGAVALSATNLPTGVTAQMSRASISGGQTSSLTLTPSGSAPLGTFTVHAHGTSGGSTRSRDVTLTVQDFNLAVSTSTLQVEQGSSTTFTVSLDNLGGFSGAVALSALGLPANASLSFSPASISGAQSSTATLTVGDVPPGTYPIALRGSAGGQLRGGTITLTVVAPPQPTGLALDRTTVIRDRSYTATVGNGAGMPIEYRFAVNGGAAQVGGPVTLDALGRVTFTTGPQSPLGAIRYTGVRRAGASAWVPVDASIQITDFALALDPDTDGDGLAVPAAGGSGSVLLHLVPQGGFAGTAALAVGASGAPAGVGFSFAPPAIGSTTASTLTATVTTPIPAGDYPLQLRATSDGVVRTLDLPFGALSQPVELAISPSTVTRGQTRQMTLSGMDFTQAAVSIAPPMADLATPRTPPTVVWLSRGPGEMVIAVDATIADLGLYTLDVTAPAGRGTAALRVTDGSPVVDIVTPVDPVPGNLHVLVIAGDNLEGAVAVALDPNVQLLGLDNSDRTLLTGLLYVAPGTAPGPTAIRLKTERGAVTVPLDIAAPGSEVARKTTPIPGSGENGMPTILFQKPRALAAGDRSGERSADGDGRSPEEKFILCLPLNYRKNWSFSRVFVVFFDAFDRPLTQAVLDALGIGQILPLRSISLVITGELHLEIRSVICTDGEYHVEECFGGSISVLVPGSGAQGQQVTFEVCLDSDFQHTSTIGASGRVVDHTWGTSSSCAEMRDLDVGSISADRSAELEVLCCEPTEITLSTTLEGLDTTFASSGTVLTLAPICVGSPFDLTLLELSFLDDHPIVKDMVTTDESGVAHGSATLIEDPVWKDADGDGFVDADPESVAYTRGSPMRVKATFRVDPIPEQPTFAEIRADGPDGIELGAITVLPAGGYEVDVELTSQAPLPAVTRDYFPFVLDWKFRTDGPAFDRIRSTQNRLFVTLADPIVGLRPIEEDGLRVTFLSALGLGIGQGGATTAQEAMESTWQRFEGPANVTTWQGRPLHYYEAGEGFRQCALDSYSLLTSVTGSGQCGSFAYLLMDALAVNGIDSTFVGSRPVDSGVGFLVGNWQYLEPSFPSEPYRWKLKFTEERPDHTFFGMVPIPPDSTYGDLQSLAGISGQSSPTPSEKAFGSHYIVRLPSPLPTGARYVDPSYGVTYVDADDFENKAVQGYFMKDTSDPPDVYRVRTSSGLHKINFDR